MAAVAAGRDHVRDDQGHPGRQPDLPGNHLRRHHEAGRERHPPAGVLRGFPGWVLYVRDEPSRGGGWKDVLVANTSKPDATELFLAARGRLVLNRDERRVDLVLTDGTPVFRRQAGRDTRRIGFRRADDGARTRRRCSSAPNCRAA